MTARWVPAATLIRHQPGTALAATPAGSTVHALNRPGGAPLCGRMPQRVKRLPLGPPAPPLRVCAFCVRALPVRVRTALDPTDAEQVVVREYADRQRRHLTPTLEEA